MSNAQKVSALIEEIRELNMAGADENGHRWANSDLIEQTCMEAMDALRAAPTPDAPDRDPANLLSVIADVREKSGLGAGPMLSELADAVGAKCKSPTPDAHSEVGVKANTLQARVQPWMMACFGPEISADKLERSDRFIEEALELVQASDYPKDRALALVEYVYGRDQGEINQEVGGVMITLAAHCLAHGVDMHEAGETELARIWTKVEQIRAKQLTKPRGSALPIALTDWVVKAEPVACNEEMLERAQAALTAFLGTWTIDKGILRVAINAANQAETP